MTLVWLAKYGGTAQISGGQIAMCRKLEEQGYCKVSKVGRKWSVKITPEGISKAKELHERDEGRVKRG